MLFCETRERDVRFLEAEWVASERRRAHSESVAAMRDCMVGGQLANAHNQIQRLGSELAAEQAAMRAQRQSWENATVHAEQNAAVHGEHAAAAAVRNNPALAVNLADGQLVSSDAARTELVRVEQNVNDLRRAFEVATQERLAESAIARSMAEENVAAERAVALFRSQGAHEIQRVRSELADAHAQRVAGLRRANDEYQREVAVANAMRLKFRTRRSSSLNTLRRYNLRLIDVITRASRPRRRWLR